MHINHTKPQASLGLRESFPAFWAGVAGLLLGLSSISAQAYDALEVRIYNQSGQPDSGISLMGIGTGSSDPTQFSMYYTNNQGTVNLTNRTMKGLAPNSPISTIFTNLPLGTDSIGTYRQMW